MILAAILFIAFIVACFLIDRRFNSVYVFLRNAMAEEMQYRQRIILVGNWRDLPTEWRRARTLPSLEKLVFRFWEPIAKYKKPLSGFYPEFQDYKIKGEN